MMNLVIGLAAVVLILLVLVDAFETVVLPRRIAHAFRFTRLFYRSTWPAWRGLARWLPRGRRREGFLSLFGPLSLLCLFASWVAGLIFGFGLLYWSLQCLPPVAGEPADFGLYLYVSGETFFTLGYGDITPQGAPGRALAVAEAGGGFGFLALVIGYVPVVYQAFSRREVTISLLDARAGSPPSGGQFLARVGDRVALGPYLQEWERWCAEVLETHLSFPLLGYYRCQHDNQSWLAALTFILDVSAALLAGGKTSEAHQAGLTFAMARHAVVDLALVFRTPPQTPDADRLDGKQWQRLREQLAAAGLATKEPAQVDSKLTELRGLYEPFVSALADYFIYSLPPVWPPGPAVDNWQTSAWTQRAPGLDPLPPVDADNYAGERNVLSGPEA
jgi:hypothetical protein